MADALSHQRAYYEVINAFLTGHGGNDTDGPRIEGGQGETIKALTG